MTYLEETRQAITPKKIRHELDCLTTVSLNVNDYCNKSCSYCPHGQGYKPAINSIMSIETAKKIRDRLHELKDKNVTPRITVSGMGEPFLNPNLKEILSILQEFCPTVLTNGSIHPDWAKNLPVVVSVHDKKEEAVLRATWPNAKFRNHDHKSPECELHVTNRNDYQETGEKYSGKCYCPFYKLVIDYDGSYLKCAEDWKRKSKVSGYDVYHKSIEEWFCDHLAILKETMVKYGREKEPACQHCDIEGTIIGEEMYNWYAKYRKS